MKLFHFGDVHYEEAKHRRQAPDGQDQGWHDVANAVEMIVNAAITNAQTEPTVLVFGGDLARTRKPSPQTYAHFGWNIARANAAGVPTIAIPGNHDIASAGDANALEPLRHVPGFHLFNQPGTAWITVDKNPEEDEIPHVRIQRNAPAEGTWLKAEAAITCMPWVTRAQAAANAGDVDQDDLLQQMARQILTVIQAEAAAPIEQGIPTFVLYHGTVTGGQTATGQQAHLFHEPAVSAIDLGNMGLAGVMLNHLHKRQELGSVNGGTPIVYSSSVERLTFGDERDTKGWVEWTWTEQQTRYTYGDTNARRFVTLTDETAWTPADVKDAIVRCRYTTGETLTDPAQMERDLLAAGAHRVVEISITPAEEDNTLDLAAVEQAADPLKALVDWLQTEMPDLDQEQRLRILDNAAELLGREPASPPIDTTGSIADYQVEPGAVWDSSMGEPGSLELEGTWDSVSADQLTF